MKNVSLGNKCTTSVVEQHVEPPPTPLIKSNHGDNLDKYFVKLKLRRGMMLDNSDLYELIILYLAMEIRNSFCCLFVTST